MSLFNINLDIIGAIRDALINFFNTLWSSLQAAFAFIWNLFQNFINWLVQTVRDLATGLIEGIKSFITNTFVSPVVTFFQNITNRFIERIPQFVAYSIAVPMAFRFPDWVERFGEFRALARFGLGTIGGWVVGEIIRALLRPRPVTLPKPQIGTVPPPGTIQPPPSPVFTILKALIANITSTVTVTVGAVTSAALTATITSTVATTLISPSTPTLTATITSTVEVSTPPAPSPNMMNFLVSTDPPFTLVSDFSDVAV
jgi:hypothetical protein